MFVDVWHRMRWRMPEICFAIRVNIPRHISECRVIFVVVLHRTRDIFDVTPNLRAEWRRTLICVFFLFLGLGHQHEQDRNVFFLLERRCWRQVGERQHASQATGRRFTRYVWSIPATQTCVRTLSSCDSLSLHC